MIKFKFNKSNLVTFTITICTLQYSRALPTCPPFFILFHFLKFDKIIIDLKTKERKDSNLTHCIISYECKTKL